HALSDRLTEVESQLLLCFNCEEKLDIKLKRLHCQGSRSGHHKQQERAGTVELDSPTASMGTRTVENSCRRKEGENGMMMAVLNFAAAATEATAASKNIPC
ncbi:hypothetical protein E3U43_001198, partial [Larimichthys crocea]